MTRTATQCRTRLEPPDSLGQFAWSCDALDDEGSGYDTVFEAYAAARAHGPIAANSGRVDPGEDMKARLAPSENQLGLALAIMRERPDIDAVVVPIALPGKEHSVWEAGQPVVAVGGFWLAREDAPRGDAESYGAARDAAERAADDWLALHGPGQPAYALIRRCGRASVFESFGRADTEGSGLPTVDDLLKILARLGFPMTGRDAALDNLEWGLPRQQTVLAMFAILALVAEFNNHTIEVDKLTAEERHLINAQSAMSICDSDPYSMNSCAVLLTMLVHDLVVATRSLDLPGAHHPTEAVSGLLRAVVELLAMYHESLASEPGANGFRPIDPEYLHRAVGYVSAAGIAMAALAAGARYDRDAVGGGCDEDVDEDSAADQVQR